MSIAAQLDAAVSANAILEASLSRIWQHHGKTGFAILTAWRGERAGADTADKLLAANKKAMAELRSDLKASGFGFVPVEGVGQEERGGKIVQAPEPSLLVPNAKRGRPAEEGELRRLVLRLGKKYEQTAVLIHDPQEGAEIVAPGGDVLGRAKTFSPSTVGEFFTRLRSGRTFRLEDLAWWGLRYGDPPGGWIEGMALENQGRVRIVECSDRLDRWLSEFGRSLRRMRETFLVQRLMPPRPKRGHPLDKAHRVFGGGMLGLSEQAWDVLDEFCEVEYMGSAEYEFGSFPRSLSELAKDYERLVTFEIVIPGKDIKPNWTREREARLVRQAELKQARDEGRKPKRAKKNAAGVPDATVYVMCRSEHRDGAEIAVRALAAGKLYTKGGSRFAEALDPAPARFASRCPVGWYELDNGWFFFTDRAMCQSVCELFGVSDAQSATIPLAPDARESV